MNLLRTLPLVVLFVMIGCGDASTLETLNGPAYQQESLASGLSKNDSQGIIKVFPAMKPITVDGLENEWARAPKHKMRLEIDAAEPSPIENKDDLSSYFKMLWDDNNLYIFASVQDEEINVNGVELFERDGFEVYIDGDNSKNGATEPPVIFPPPAYDTNDDFIRFVVGEDNAFGTWGYIDPSNIEFAFSTTSRGYNLEIRIPFADLPDFPAEAGHVFGVEFQTNDNDNDERQNFLKWNSEEDNSWYNPSLFGTAVLFKD